MVSKIVMHLPRGEPYRRCSRLREHEPSPQDEHFLQRLWFEAAYRNPLTSTTGESIQILSPGFWNHGSGPDFLRCSLRNGQGEIEVGAVEIHLRPPAWTQHGHDLDRAYDRVILHVVWDQGPRGFFPGTSQNRAIRQVELGAQLKAPLPEIRSLFQSLPSERQAGARLGICHREFQALSRPEMIAIVKEAGWHRFQEKSRRWIAREKLHGFSQALWLGLAEALGYSENKAPFWLLAQRLPIDELRKIKPPLRREAMLFGLAGFLPDKGLDSPSRSGREWLRSLWDEWWKMRAEFGDQSLPRDSWCLRGIRPSNRPERRLAILALAASHWPALEKAARSADPDALNRVLDEWTHPFWSRHLTLNSARLPKPLSLLGESRRQSLLFNVVWPLAWQKKQPEVETLLLAARSPLPNKSSRLAAFRLLHGLLPSSALRPTLIQEGLIQIWQDYCLTDEDQCRQCTFPEFVSNWKNERNRSDLIL